MNNAVLVTYASRGGSTLGVAEAIGKTLVEAGLRVEVLSMQDVRHLSPYRAVVAGSAVQGGQWLPEALQFIQTYRSDLSRKTFAAFQVCMTLAMKNGAYRSHVSTWMAPVRALVRPVSEGLFAGAFDIHKVPSAGDRFKFRMTMLMGVWPNGDHRDWNAVHEWAESLVPVLINESKKLT
jgi:menaquinone-dependent protoporphyrinogen oxidase